MGELRFLGGFFDQTQCKSAYDRIADPLREHDEVPGNRSHFLVEVVEVCVRASLDLLRMLKAGQTCPNRPEFIFFQSC